MRITASIDVVVFVARRRDGVRRVEAVAEVDGRDRAGVRALFEHHDGRLLAVARPSRPPRRPDSPSPVETEPRC